MMDPMPWMRTGILQDQIDPPFPLNAPNVAQAAVNRKREMRMKRSGIQTYK